MTLRVDHDLTLGTRIGTHPLFRYLKGRYIYDDLGNYLRDDLKGKYSRMADRLVITAWGRQKRFTGQVWADLTLRRKPGNSDGKRTRTYIWGMLC